MLTICPECELQVSTKALSCPHCGNPMTKGVSNIIKKSKNTRRKRLPNGFGQISEIKNKRLRRCFRAMVPVGRSESGRYICKPLKPESYFETYNDAYAALVEYHKHPYDLKDGLTVKEVYEKWSEQYFKTLESTSSFRTIKSAWNYCSSVYDMRIIDIRARHIKYCMEEGTFEYRGVIKTPSPTTKSRIKSLFNLMLDYAVEFELVDRNYARTFDVSDTILEAVEQQKRAHLSFKDEEMDALWKNSNTNKYIKLILIQCYSGWRPQELGLIKLEDVDLENWIYKGGMKTKSGKDRLVPIHTKIRPFVKEFYQEAQILKSPYLINCTDNVKDKRNYKMTYDCYKTRYATAINMLGLNPDHRPHDPRKQFATMCKKYNVDEYALKYMIGHKIQDLTERTYTDREVEWLKTEIEKIE